MNILIYKTSVNDALMVSALRPGLDNLAGRGKWNFDLSDCDKILRIESPTIQPNEAIELLKKMGIRCDELED